MGMTEETFKSKWWERMMTKYGSEEAVREVMRRNADKSKRNKGGKGGFASLDPAVHKELSARGGKHRNEHNDPDSDKQSVHQPGSGSLPGTDSDRT